MRMYLPLISIMSLTMSLVLAEPPVGDGYPSTRSSQHNHDHDHENDHNNDFQRSLSQEYGPPSIEVARSLQEDTLPREYLPPNARTANSRSSQSHRSSNARDGISLENGVPSARSSAGSRGLSTKYGVPNARSGSTQTHRAPAERSGLSQEYGIPSMRSNNARTPIEKHGAPSQRNFGGAPLQKYGPPAVVSARSGNFEKRVSNPKSSAKSFASSTSRSFKGSSQSASRSPSTSYGTPAVRSSKSRSQKVDSLRQTYGARNQGHQSDSYKVSSASGLSEEYGVPTSRAANQMTSAMPSTYSPSTRSAPSDTNNAPSARNSIPSEQYGVPNQDSSLSNKGYSAARNALNEDLDEESASYDFAYKVEDYESGSDFGHTETRQDNRAEGAYFVVLPDGTKQVVEYEADERGFKPRISVEPTDLARSGGYDDDAAELGRSSNGPY